MKFKTQLLFIFLVFMSSCAPKEPASTQLPIPTLMSITQKSTTIPTVMNITPKPTITFPAVATVQMKTKYLAYDVVQDSQTYIALLPIECLGKKGPNCQERGIPDTYQRDMAGPLIWDASGNKLGLISNINGKQNLTILSFDTFPPTPTLFGTPEREDCPTWSPDGKRLAITKENSANEKPGPELWLIALDKQEQKLTDEGGCASWSPDGLSILFTHYTNDANLGGNIYLLNTINLSALDKTTLKTNLDRVANASFSPDGTQIVFDGIKNDRQSIYMIKTNGAGLQELTATLPEASSPIWSPTGKQIVFTSQTSHTTPREIYVMDSVGKHLLNITNTPTWDDYSPAWSPDGTQLAYVSLRDSGQFNIYVVNKDGTGLAKVTDETTTSEFNYPSWQP